MHALAEQQTADPAQNRHSTLLSPISWQTYERLLMDLGEESKVQLTYDQGYLEIIMSPLLPPHEIYSTLIHDFIRILGDELAIDICSLGSTTLRREDLQRGLEPDRSYYIQHESIVRDKQELDLNQLPPPDLVVEIDITSLSINKLPIYLTLGIPEIWRYNENNLYIYQLMNNDYALREESSTFKNLPVQTVIPQFIKQRFQVGERKVLSEFRQWVKEQITC